MSPELTIRKAVLEGMDFLLTVEDVAAILACDSRTVWRLAKKPGFPQTIKINRRLVRWSGKALQAWLDLQAREKQMPLLIRHG